MYCKYVNTWRAKSNQSGTAALAPLVPWLLKSELNYLHRPLVSGCSTGHKSCPSMLADGTPVKLKKAVFTKTDQWHVMMAANPNPWLSYAAVRAGPRYGSSIHCSATKWCHHHKMAAPVSDIFWFHFCAVGRSGDASSVFFLLKLSWYSQRVIPTINEKDQCFSYI